MHTVGRFAFRLIAAVLVWTCCCESVAPAAERTSSYLAALESIRVDDLRQHVNYLARDEFQGREAGQRGGRAAGDYLAGRFRDLGLAGAGIDGGFLQPFSANFRNILGMFSGSDPELKNHFVIIGAHYDHVGYGTRRNSRGPVGQIHNGADDNASGVSGLLELAEAFAMLPELPKRSVLFAGWDAEEKGLLGSKHWVSHPTVPLDRVAAVVNMDMIGRLRQQRLIVLGWRSGAGLRRLASQQNDGPGLLLDFPWPIKPKADHFTFFQRGIPVLMLHTGLHDQFHTPYDDAKLIEVSGMRRVTRLAFHILYELADQPRVPVFRPAAGYETEATRESIAQQVSRPPERLGVAWRPQSEPAEGVYLIRVAYGSPAHRAKLRSGDRIVRFAGHQIRTDGDLRAAVMGAVNPVTAVVRRPGNPQPLEVTIRLRGDPMRLGISWRVDDAEPKTIILTHVALDSPAARSGLRNGDRIYQILGSHFSNEAEFASLTKTLPGPLQLIVERNGRLRTVVVRFESHLLNRAA